MRHVTNRRLAVLAVASLAASSAFAGSYSAAKQAAGTIVDGAVASADHGTLVAAVKAAGLVDTLQGDGPFTVFAPTDAAFAKLPAGTVDTLLRPENKADLTRVLTYHVVAGEVGSADLVEKIRAAGGSATLRTVAGADLTAKLDAGKVVLVDEKGGSATVTVADLDQSNGVIHVIDAVVLPN
jgi:uncharacterized surface protein with fasciclin (FAS1) repeats